MSSLIPQQPKLPVQTKPQAQPAMADAAGDPGLSAYEQMLFQQFADGNDQGNDYMRGLGA